MQDQRYKFVKSLDFAISAIALTMLIVLTCAGVIMRYVFDKPFSWLEEVQMALIVWATFFGGSLAFRQKAHVAIEILVEALPQKIQKALRYIVFFIVIGILLFIIPQSISFIAQLIRTDRITSILHIPYALIYSAVPIGSLLMLFSFIVTEGRELFFQKRSKGESV